MSSGASSSGNAVEPETEQGCDEGLSVGKIFDSVDEAETCYQEYGRQCGFWICKKSAKKRINRLDMVTNIQFVCHREGIHVKKYNQEDKEEGVNKKRTRNTSTMTCNCKAQMCIKYQLETNKWKVTVFDNNHNHGFVSPSKRNKMRSNREMPNHIKNLTEKFHSQNVRVSKIPSLFYGDVVGFDKRDCYNHSRNLRLKTIHLDGGDAQSVLTYFVDKVSSDPQFFYAIQMDENDRAVNIFWVDGRSRASYGFFGDVVVFDTTYRTNKYKMQFAPFTGVNHHMQSIQFGCALMQDETEISFKWLFETWLKAMGGCAPNAILTDQDLAMKAEIAKVFPNTHHRLCIWHIKKKFVEKLGQVYYKKSNFKKEVKKCIWSTYKREDFEERWIKLMKDFGLGNNEWLQQLYNIREFWVPVYNRSIFFAGMNTTGRSEGMNSFFNDFVNPKTNLKEFVLSYEEALKRIVNREMEEDYESEDKFRMVENGEFLLKHAASVYTRNVFAKFKVEVKDAMMFKVEEMRSEDAYQLFLVKSKIFDSEKFIVSMNLESGEGKCECQYFEFVGLLCKHVLKVFLHKDIDTIPEHFIIPRWRQKANIFRNNFNGLIEDNGTEEAKKLRITRHSEQVKELIYLAADSLERSRVFTKYIDDLHGILLGIPADTAPDTKQEDLLQTTQTLISDPNISQTKGRKKDGNAHSGRFKSGLELATSKKKRHCKCCKKLVFHDKRTCPENPTSKNYTGAMELCDSQSDDEEEN